VGPQTASFTVAYVIILAITGPLVARFVGSTTATDEGAVPADAVPVS
jgi:hypothetical protein